LDDQQQPSANVGLQPYIFQTRPSGSYFHAWSTILEFNNEPISDLRALTLVKLAYEEMVSKSSGTLLDRDGVPVSVSRYMPGVMTALITPARTIVVLASSLRKATKGQHSLIPRDYLLG
jgi:hypothetical protein